MTEFFIPANAISFIVILLDEKFFIKSVNNYALKILKRQESELKGQDYFQLSKEFAHIPFLSRSELSSKKSTFILSLVLPGPGQSIFYAWRVSPLDNGYLLIANDITKENAFFLENQIQTQEEDLTRFYLESILMNLPCYVYWKNKNMVYQGCNKKFALAAGLEHPDDVIGKTDYDLAWTEAEAEAFRKDDMKVLEGYSKLSFEEPQRQANKETLIVLASKVPVKNRQGNIIGLLGIYVDITTYKEAEKNLIQAKKRAEEANKFKTDFLSSISHELRIPLTGILGMARLLKEEIPSNKEEYKKVIDIVDAGEHLLSLVNDLLDLTKLEANKVELELKQVNIFEQIDQVVTILSPLAEKKKIDLLARYEQNLPCLVISDPRVIRQIFLNIAGNAVKFTEEGYICIDVKIVKKNKTEMTLAFSIIDTGIGIPQEKLESIFDRFVQVDSSFNRSYSGTGLGLAISREYIKLLNGDIRVESDLHRGSKFVCTIPFKLQAVFAEHKNLHSIKARILIVDDSPYSQTILNYFDDRQSEICSSEKALEVLLRAQEHYYPFDIVIIMQALKNYTSFYLAREISYKITQHPVLLLLTVEKNSVAILDKAKQAGFSNCLHKSMDSARFLNILDMEWQRWQFPQISREIKQKKNIKQNLSQSTLEILLVEDDLIVRKVHQNMLTKFAWNVDVANDADKALRKASKNYDIILMDIGLPDMTGIECIREIRKLKNHLHTPVIGLTGYQNNFSIQACLDAGLNTIVIKPVTPQKLKDIILRHLEQSDQI